MADLIEKKINEKRKLFDAAIFSIIQSMVIMMKKQLLQLLPLVTMRTTLPIMTL